MLTEADARELEAALKTTEGREQIAQTMYEPRPVVNAQLINEGFVKSGYMLETLKAADRNVVPDNSADDTDNQQGRSERKPSETTRQTSTGSEDIVHNHSRDSGSKRVNQTMALIKLQHMRETPKAISSSNAKNGIDITMDNPQESLSKLAICQLCGFAGLHLGTHIPRVHKINCKEYRVKFPGSILVTQGWKASYKLAMLTAHGVTSPLKNTKIKARQHEKAKNTTRERYGVENVFFSTELQKKYRQKAKNSLLKKYGVTNPSKIPGVQEKIRVSAQCLPNKLERVAIRCMPVGVEFVGDGKFWIRTAAGPKNPDFVVRPFSSTKKIIEIFGGMGHWHTNEEALLVINAYKDVGVECLILTDSCFYLKNRCHRVRTVIDRFVTKSSSETFPEELFYNYDKVRSVEKFTGPLEVPSRIYG